MGPYCARFVAHEGHRALPPSSSFEVKSDAERVWVALGKRLGRYGLALHPEKTRLMRFRRPPKSQDGGKGPGTFDFLGSRSSSRKSRMVEISSYGSGEGPRETRLPGLLEDRGG